MTTSFDVFFCVVCSVLHHCFALLIDQWSSTQITCFIAHPLLCASRAEEHGPGDEAVEDCEAELQGLTMRVAEQNYSESEPVSVSSLSILPSCIVSCFQ